MIGMTLRQYYDERLDQLRADVLRMGTLASDMVRSAVEATINGDLALAEKVIQDDDEVDRLEHDILGRTVLTVMQESPVASDLRTLVSFLSVIPEIEKIGDHAVKLSRRATKLTGHFPAEMKLALSELGEETRKMVGAALRLCDTFDGELATEVIKGDKGIDGRYVAARDRLIGIIQENPHETQHLIRTIEAFHALEHVADNAVQIAARLKLHHEA